MSSVYGLHCTVCETTYEDITDWLGHLLTDGHQIKARKTTLEWGKDDRKCVIIAFSTFSMGTFSNAEKLLNYFSVKDVDRDRVVHDFVWWPGSMENMALLQFESRKIVNKILEGKENHMIDFPDYSIQFRKASKCLDLEWNFLVGKDDGNAMDEPVDIEIRDVKEKGPPQDRDDENDSQVQRLLSPPSTRNETRDLSLEFQTLLKSIEIPDEEYSQYMQILQDVREVLENYEVNMYRNFNLRLRNPGSDFLLLHIRDPENPLERPDPILMLILLNLLSRKYLPSGFSIRPQQQPHRYSYNGSDGILYSNPKSGLGFALTTHPSRIVDVQMSRLILYYLTFDPRVKPFFSLIYIWYSANEICFGEREIPTNHLDSNVPEPAALDWIIILFLSQRGILPTVDPVFAKEWKPNQNDSRPEENSEEFILSLFNLVKEFFTFLLPIFSSGEWILNPRHGEVHSRHDFLEGIPGKTWNTKLANNEIASIRRPSRQTGILASAKSKHLMIHDRTISVLHPFNPLWRLSFNDELDKADLRNRLEATITRLEMYLETSKLNRGCGSMKTVLVGPNVVMKNGRDEEGTNDEEERGRNKRKVSLSASPGTSASTITGKKRKGEQNRKTTKKV